MFMILSFFVGLPSITCKHLFQSYEGGICQQVNIYKKKKVLYRKKVAADT